MNPGDALERHEDLVALFQVVEDCHEGDVIDLSWERAFELRYGCCALF